MRLVALLGLSCSVLLELCIESVNLFYQFLHVKYYLNVLLSVLVGCDLDRHLESGNLCQLIDVRDEYIVMAEPVIDGSGSDTHLRLDLLPVDVVSLEGACQELQLLAGFLLSRPSFRPWQAPLP